MSENEMIDKLKNNWTAWGGLSKEERKFLTGNWGRVDWHNGDRWVRATCSVDTLKIGRRDIFRLFPYFKLPEKKEGRWVEYEIFPSASGQFYWCDVEHLRDEDIRKGTHELPSIVGFGGVQFKGQSAINHWSMILTSFIGGCGGLTSRSNDGKKPATPIKALFWVVD